MEEVFKCEDVVFSIIGHEVSYFVDSVRNIWVSAHQKVQWYMHFPTIMQYGKRAQTHVFSVSMVGHISDVNLMPGFMGVLTGLLFSIPVSCRIETVKASWCTFIVPHVHQ